MSDLLQPVPVSEFRIETLYEAERKLHDKSLERRASISDTEIRHIATYNRDIATQAIAARRKAHEDVERQRLVLQAKARAGDVSASHSPTRFLGPRDDETWEQFVERGPGEPTPILLFETLKKFVIDINEKNKVRNARLDELERHIKDRPQLRYRGDWEPAADYAEADLVTHSGSVWFCQIATSGIAPSVHGIATSAWKLFCARGRQGKTGGPSEADR